MSVPLELLVEHLKTIGILARDTVHNSIPAKSTPRDSDDLVHELVRRNKLTLYQANEISRGNAESLVLGNYVLLERIGAGAMGQVFKAEHRRMHRIVAIKVLSEEAGNEPGAVLRFEREVAAAARIVHPNVVTVYDADCVNGIHFLVMDFVEGRDLSAVVNQGGPVSVRDAVNYLLQAAQGLQAAHYHGVIHRDIKPANLFLTTDGTIKILDMGLARLSSDDDVALRASLTSTSIIMGTVDYMSPEQALNTSSADGRTDIYALGCTFYFLLTGRTVYDGGTLMKKLLAHREEPIPSLQTLRPEVPARLESIYKKMMAKSVEDRYQTMQELIADLRGYQQDNQETAVFDKPTVLNHPPPLRKDSPYTVALTPVSRETTTAEGLEFQRTKVEKKRKRSDRVMRLAFLCSLFALLGLVVFSVKTKSGTLVISVDESEVQVDVLDQEGNVEVSRKGVDGKISIAVDSGKHRLKLTKDGFEVFGKDFEIQSGGQRVITATLTPLGKNTGSIVDNSLSPELEASSEKAATDFAKYPSEGFDRLITQIMALPAEKQLEAVSHLLQERNAGFDGKLSPKIENGIVTELRLFSDNVTDISPLRAFQGLIHLNCGGSDPARCSGRLFDLSPLAGLRLSELFCSSTHVCDLSPLKGMPLVELNIANTFVSDLSPLDSRSLTVLEISSTRVTDLSPLRGMPLRFFSFADTHVTDLSPIKETKFVELHLGPDVSDLSPIREMPVERLFLKFTEQLDPQLLRAISSLQTINGQARLEFCEALEAYQSGMKRPLAFEDPNFDDWVRHIVSLSTDLQLQAVAGKLQELNPGFDGKLVSTTDQGGVVQLELDTEWITDLSPVRVFSDLRILNCSIRKEFAQRGLCNISPLKGLKLTSLNLANTHVSDLSPLVGMPLARLHCYRTNVVDLSPLSAMPLTDLNLIANPVSDLSPLKGLPLTGLSIVSTSVTDLSPLRGMPLIYLECSKTNVTDLSPLKELPLVWLSCDLMNDSDLQLVRSIRTLGTINGRSAAEFWKYQQVTTGLN